MKKTLYFHDVYLSQDDDFANDYCIGDYSCEIEVKNKKVFFDEFEWELSHTFIELLEGEGREDEEFDDILCDLLAVYLEANPNIEINNNISACTFICDDIEYEPFWSESNRVEIDKSSHRISVIDLSSKKSLKKYNKKADFWFGYTN